MGIGLAVLGAGRWGTHLIRNFWADDRATIVAIADPSDDRLKQVAQRFNFGNSVDLTQNWRDLLGRSGVDAIVVATPAVTHFEIIEAALTQGYHVLAEKPLTLSASDAYALCHLAQEQQRLLVVDHTYLFHPAVQRGKAVLEAQGIGNPRYGYASRTHLGPVRQDVDALWDLAIHDLAIFNYWLGAEPIAVQAEGTIWLQPQQQTSLSPTGLADLVWVTLTYPGGLQVKLHLCWLNPDKQRRLVLAGDRGALIFDELSNHPLVLQQGWFTQGNDRLFTPTDQQTEVLTIDPDEPLQRVCGHFLDCIAENKPSTLSDGWVGAGLVKTLEALSDSLNSEFGIRNSELSTSQLSTGNG
jgi:predicted dehydrogenase